MAKAYIEVSLTQGKLALIDIDDANIILKHKWYAMTRRTRKSFYAVRGNRLNGVTRLQYMHKLLKC